jgi:CheY-like chemotaxis protein
MVMPVMNGLEAAPLLIKILPKVWLILLTSHDFPQLDQIARSAGIHAVVPKNKAVTHLIAQAEALFGMAERYLSDTIRLFICIDC